jgi:hypothetical protein
MPEATMTTRRTVILLMLGALVAIIGYAWFAASRGAAPVLSAPTASSIDLEEQPRGQGLVGGVLWWP